MPTKPIGLGKGLAALIPDPDPVPIEGGGEEEGAEGQQRSGLLAQASASAGAGVGQHQPQGGTAGMLRVALGRIEPNPDQPRKAFSEASLAELADSIRRHGLIQPIIVEEMERGQGRYRIVAGERRWRAAGLAALKDIPVIVRNFTPERRLEISLIENVQREDLNPVEEAEAYRSLMELTGCTQEEVADKVGKSRPTIANALRLLKLTAPMLEALGDGKLSAGHARAILAVADPTEREILFGRVLAEDLNVRQTEAAAQDYGRGRKFEGGRQGGTAAGKGGGKGGAGEDRRPAEIDEAERRLMEAFGTKVSVKGDLKKGVITIEYYSMEDLERILEAGGK